MGADPPALCRHASASAIKTCEPHTGQEVGHSQQKAFHETWHIMAPWHGSSGQLNPCCMVLHGALGPHLCYRDVEQSPTATCHRAMPSSITLSHHGTIPGDTRIVALCSPSHPTKCSRHSFKKDPKLMPCFNFIHRAPYSCPW